MEMKILDVKARKKKKVITPDNDLEPAEAVDMEKRQKKLNQDLLDRHGALAPRVYELLVSRPNEAALLQLENWERIRRPSIDDYKRWWVLASRIGKKPGVSVSTKKVD